MTYTVTMNEIEMKQFQNFQKLNETGSNYASIVDADTKSGTLIIYSPFGNCQQYAIDKVTHESSHQTTYKVIPSFITP